MAWIESHTVLLRHRKLVEMAKELRIKPVYLMGHLHSLWHVALEQQEDGDLSSWTAPFIAESSCFDGNVDQWVSLLQSFGWLDGKLLHDWLDYAGLYLTKKYNTSDREKLVRIWAKHGKVYGSEPLENGKRTKREPTLPNLTKDSMAPPGVQIPEDLVESTAEIQDWLEYKRQRRQAYKPKGLEAFWRVLRAIPPDKRRESVDWCMANNWSGLFEKKANGSAPEKKPKKEFVI